MQKKPIMEIILGDGAYDRMKKVKIEEKLRKKWDKDEYACRKEFEMHSELNKQLKTHTNVLENYWCEECNLNYEYGFKKGAMIGLDTAKAIEGNDLGGNETPIVRMLFDTESDDKIESEELWTLIEEVEASGKKMREKITKKEHMEMFGKYEEAMGQMRFAECRQYRAEGFRFGLLMALDIAGLFG